MRPTRKTGVRWTAAVAVGAAAAPAAQGFYFRGWPGDGLPRQPTLVSPVTDEGPGRQARHPDILTDDPPPRSPPAPPAAEDNPEPGTLLLAVVGAGAVAVVRRARR